MMTRQWVRLTEARDDVLGVTDWTWRRLLAAGALVRRRLPGTKQWRYLRPELERLKREMAEEGSRMLKVEGRMSGKAGAGTGTGILHRR